MPDVVRDAGGGSGAEAVMMLLPSSVKVYVAVQPVNMRKSFEGLSNEVRSAMGADPMSGHVFCFLNRMKTMVKLLVWTRGGFTIVHKRLERGRFTFVAEVKPGAMAVTIDAAELAMLLEGIDARGARRSLRHKNGA
jgi:transposase